MKEVHIEIYNDDHKGQVTELIPRIQHDEFGIDIDLAAQPDIQNIPGYYQVNNGNFWVAMDEDKVVGTISLLDIGNHSGALRKMFVDKDYRGKEWGVGRQLFQTLLDWAKEKGFKEILLGTTAKFLAAHRFYEKNGFIEIDKNLLPSSFPVMSVDVKFYKYVLE